MHNGMMGRVGVRALDLGGGGGGGGLGAKKKEYLMVGVLAAIICAALALAIWQFLGGGSSKRGNIPPTLRYKCAECGHEWEIPTEDIAKMDPASADLMSGAFIPSCPKCGAQSSGERMIECPVCGTWFVSEMARFDRKMFLGKDTGDIDYSAAKEICPTCPTDVLEYRRKQPRERKK